MGASLSLSKLATRDSTLERADSLGPQTSEKLDVLLNSTTVVTTHITIQKKRQTENEIKSMKTAVKERNSEIKR